MSELEKAKEAFNHLNQAMQYLMDESNPRAQDLMIAITGNWQWLVDKIQDLEHDDLCDKSDEELVASGRIDDPSVDYHTQPGAWD